jgi:hypothetical protein
LRLATPPVRRRSLQFGQRVAPIAKNLIAGCEQMLGDFGSDVSYPYKANGLHASSLIIHLTADHHVMLRRHWAKSRRIIGTQHCP